MQTAESDFQIHNVPWDNNLTIAEIKVLAFILCGLLALVVVHLYEEEPHGTGDPRHRPGRPRRACHGDRYRQGLCLHVLAQRGNLRCGGRADFNDLGHSAILRHLSFDPFFRHRYSGRVRKPAGRYNGRAWPRGSGNFGGFVLGAEFQQAVVVGLLLLVLVWRQVQMRKLRQVVN